MPGGETAGAEIMGMTWKRRFHVVSLGSTSQTPAKMYPNNTLKTNICDSRGKHESICFPFGVIDILECISKTKISKLNPNQSITKLKKTHPWGPDVCLLGWLTWETFLSQPKLKQDLFRVRRLITPPPQGVKIRRKKTAATTTTTTTFFEKAGFFLTFCGLSIMWAWTKNPLEKPFGLSLFFQLCTSSKRKASPFGAHGGCGWCGRSWKRKKPLFWKGNKF